MADGKGETTLPRGLIVGSMCHCDFPDECDDHWQFFTNAEMNEDGEHVRRGRTLTESEMRAMADVVNHMVSVIDSRPDWKDPTND